MVVLARILGCCLLFAVSAANADGERLRWLINDFPPFTEVGPQMPGPGIAADMLRYLQQHMPQYHHEFEEASFARAYALMERGEPVCHSTTLKLPGREKAMLFSRPVFFLSAQKVLVREDRIPQVAPYIDGAGRVDVRRLLADTQLVTAVSERRGYSPKINAALREVGYPPQLLKAGVNFGAPLQQLAAGWIDYLFAYPLEVGWYQRQHPEMAGTALRQLAVAGDPPYTLGYIACVRSEWGVRVIRDIDAQLVKAGPRPPWIDMLIDYLPLEERQSYEQALVEHKPFAQP